jgi:hypothetical protein
MWSDHAGLRTEFFVWILSPTQILASCTASPGGPDAREYGIKEGKKILCNVDSKRLVQIQGR